ncbi:hypothetical protein [Trinickia symbiotica]|nr:hypothetical protein [Trinickia symbiotica]
MALDSALSAPIPAPILMWSRSAFAIGRSTPAGLLRFLFDRVNELETEELEFLSQSNELAGHMAMNLASVVSGIGSLVACDDHAGNFRDDGDSLSDLLFTIANQVEVIGELSNIGFEATTLLRTNDGDGAGEPGCRRGGRHNG